MDDHAIADDYAVMDADGFADADAHADTDGNANGDRYGYAEHDADADQYADDHAGRRACCAKCVPATGQSINARAQPSITVGRVAIAEPDEILNVVEAQLGAGQISPGIACAW
ncbi:MAG: hypothetical protein U0694_16610 [Anaerolineae bacterium]